MRKLGFVLVVLQFALLAMAILAFAEPNRCDGPNCHYESDDKGTILGPQNAIVKDPYTRYGARKIIAWSYNYRTDYDPTLHLRITPRRDCDGYEHFDWYQSSNRFKLLFTVVRYWGGGYCSEDYEGVEPDEVGTRVDSPYDTDRESSQGDGGSEPVVDNGGGNEDPGEDPGEEPDEPDDDEDDGHGNHSGGGDDTNPGGGGNDDGHDNPGNGGGNDGDLGNPNDDDGDPDNGGNHSGGGDGTNPGGHGNDDGFDNPGQGGGNPHDDFDEGGDPDNGGGGGSEDHGNNGVGNGEDPAPPGNPPENDGDGTGPGNPGNQGGGNGKGNQD